MWPLQSTPNWWGWLWNGHIELVVVTPGRRGVCNEGIGEVGNACITGSGGGGVEGWRGRSEDCLDSDGYFLLAPQLTTGLRGWAAQPIVVLE